MNKPAVSVIVPVAGNADLTVRCFRSVRERSVLPFELIWVDNGSSPSDFSVIRRQAELPGTNCIVIVNQENLGFIKATNQGIAQARGDYVILLNNDTEVMAGWDAELVKPLMHFPEVGAVGPMTNNSAWQTPHKASWQLNINIPKNTNTYLSSIEKYKDIYVNLENNSLSFFCTAFRKSTFDKIGSLWEALSVGLGDDDEYCMRLRKNNYQLWLSFGTFVLHVHRATFNSLKLGLESLQRHNIKMIRERYGKL